MTLLPASKEFLSKFPSSRYLSSSGSYPLYLSGLGDPAGSNATAGLALRVTGTHKPLCYDKVKIPSGGHSYYNSRKLKVYITYMVSLIFLFFFLLSLMYIFVSLLPSPYQLFSHYEILCTQA
jgi:hypothetical protein